MIEPNQIERAIDRTYQGQSLMRIAAMILRDNAHNQNQQSRLSPQDIDDVANLCELAEECLGACYEQLEDFKRASEVGVA